MFLSFLKVWDFYIREKKVKNNKTKTKNESQINCEKRLNKSWAQTVCPKIDYNSMTACKIKLHADCSAL